MDDNDHYAEAREKILAIVNEQNQTTSRDKNGVLIREFRCNNTEREEYVKFLRDNGPGIIVARKTTPLPGGIVEVTLKRASPNRASNVLCIDRLICSPASEYDQKARKEV